MATGLLLGVVAIPALAGGGPENLFLLVNAQSDDSKTIANHYIELRKIPSGNVLYLDWTDSVERTTVEAFRNKILKPALAMIQKRGLEGQIDYLVYSAGFPWLVDLKGDFADKKLPRQLAPTASLTGVTYLWRFVAARDVNMLGLTNNLYVQRRDKVTERTKSWGFRSWYGWGPEGKRSEAGGQSYLLSTMLGVTSGRGNTVGEVRRYLQSAARADGTHPKQTIYFMKNGNVRSTTRDWAFRAAAAELEELGVAAKVLDGTIPKEKNDVLGAVIGTASFDWKASGSRILPGAICEHLTSFGGVLRKGAGQTALTDLLRYGAAGASGTVTEPFAIQQKFPLATVQVHYARGCTLAESFYQSVSGPYQLLIVGDPLCRPWANIPQPIVTEIKPGATLSGEVSIKPTAESPRGVTVARYELFVDGRRRQRCRTGESLQLDTRTLADGYHELRLVAIESSEIASQGRVIIPVMVNNHDRQVTLETSSGRTIKAGAKIELSVRCSGAAQIVVHHNGHVLGRIDGNEGTINVDAAQLGRGTVQLQALAQGPVPALSRPLELRIE